MPIPVFYDKATDEPVINEETSAHIQQLFRKLGTDAWWNLPIDELLPPSMKAQADRCVVSSPSAVVMSAYCASRLRRGDDTMDVWFDSGVSWDSVLREYCPPPFVF